MNKGFTLIEMLVVVLIIGILASIALPQYQKAVQKSKFASLMTNASALYDAEEAFYLMNRQYTSNQEDLDIKVHDGNTGIYLSHSWNYVFAERPDLSNRLVMYLDHSRQFPGEIHCEAAKGNRLANELCSGGMGGRPVTGASGTSTKFKAYVLEGSGQGIPQGYDVNGDGVINGGDLSDVINGILGTGSDPEKDRDINGDGVVDDKDKQCIYDIILGNGLESNCLSD